MKILKFRTIHGPNVYHSKPVIVMKVDLGLWTDQSSQELHGFTEKLMNLFPALIEHTCSPGHYGGFYERLLRGTYLGHIIEHVAIELSSLAGTPVTFGKTVYAGKKGHYNVVTRFQNELAMKEALTSAFYIVEAIVLKQPIELDVALEKIKKLADESRLGPSGDAIVKAAQNNGIPFRRVGNDSLIRLGFGKNQRWVQAAVTDRTSNIAVELVQDKAMTKQYLQNFNVPVPEGFVVDSIEGLKDISSHLKFPLAVKPFDGHHGQGVSLNLQSENELHAAYAIARKFSSSVLVEEMCYGKDYRVLVINYKVVAASERIPPFIVGDGKSTVKELIEVLNTDPRRAEGHCRALTKIEIDDILIKTLKNKSLNLQSILPVHERVFLRENANLSSGGTAKDVTNLVNAEVKTLCERIARLVNLDICGIDLIHSDISEGINHGLKVIEINAGPGLRMHLSPNEGKPQDVGQKIIDMLYPKPEHSRIPIVSVTGTNGKTSTVRMLKKIFSSIDKTNVGMTSSDGIWIGDEKIADGDTSGPASAEMILNDPKVDCAIFELARGGLLRGGLAYDQCDIGIVTNIRPDHIGQDGIDDLEDLVRIKSLIVEHVKENGDVILNADDPESLGLMNRKNLFKLNKNVILYSLDPYNIALSQQLAKNKDACWLQDEMIHIRYKGEVKIVGHANSLPVTMGGAAQFQISNLLATVAAATAAGISAEKIYAALQDFNPNVENSGRVNLYKIHGGYVFLDYAHNPDGISAIGEMLQYFKGYRKTAILGLPGDRDTDLIIQSGHAAAKYFERIVLRDDFDLRDRAPAEVPELIHDVIKDNYPNIEIEVIPNENLAIETVLNQITAKDIVVLFYDILEPVMKSLRQFDPVAVNSIEQLAPRFASASNEELFSINPEEDDYSSTFYEH